MSEDLYKPPQTELVEPGSQTNDLAARSTRFWAAMLDAVISLAIFAPILWWAGVFDGFPEVKPLSTGMSIGLGVAGLAINIALNGWLVAKRGQSLGKAALGIKMVRTNGAPLDFGRWLGLRVVPLAAVSQVPVASQFLPLIDVLFIFRADRRCVHDLIADTIVVKC